MVKSLKGEFNISFYDMYNRIGIGWTNEDGTRDAVGFELPEDIKLKIFQVRKNTTKTPEEYFG